MEENKIPTNVDDDIRKYCLSPLVSARYMHPNAHMPVQKTESKKGLKPSGKQKKDITINFSERDELMPKHSAGHLTTTTSLPSLSVQQQQTK